MGVLATYVHDLNPIALPIYGGLALRWYGLAYLMGFVAGFLLLRNLARRGLWVMAPDKVADFIAACALFGVFLGGRLGYILFYHLPKVGWGSLLHDPMVIFRVWEGGMASHGGIAGQRTARPGQRCLAGGRGEIGRNSGTGGGHGATPGNIRARGPQRRRRVGSSAWRSASPSVLKASAVSRMAMPGAYICSGANSM